MRPQSNILEVPQVAQTISFPFRKELASKSAHLICHSASLMDSTYCALEMRGRIVWTRRDWQAAHRINHLGTEGISAVAVTGNNSWLWCPAQSVGLRHGPHVQFHGVCCSVLWAHFLLASTEEAASCSPGTPGLACQRSLFRRDLDGRGCWQGGERRHSCCECRNPGNGKGGECTISPSLAFSEDSKQVRGL